MAMLAGIPGSMAGASYLRTTTEPVWIAQRYWVRDALRPILVAQERHDYAIEYLIQQQTLKALQDAKADMSRAPNQTTEHTIEQLEKSVRERQQKLDRMSK